MGVLSLFDKYVFQGIGYGVDSERLSERMLKVFCGTLDRCDLEAIDYNDCGHYVGQLLEVCNNITMECTSMTLDEWGIIDEARFELAKAWRHFVRIIWIRDLAWENILRYLSDPNREW